MCASKPAFVKSGHICMLKYLHVMYIVQLIAANVTFTVISTAWNCIISALKFHYYQYDPLYAFSSKFQLILMAFSCNE